MIKNYYMSSIVLENGSWPRWSDHPGGVHDDLPGGQEDDPVLLRSGYHSEQLRMKYFKFYIFCQLYFSLSPIRNIEIGIFTVSYWTQIES